MSLPSAHPFGSSVTYKLRRAGETIATADGFQVGMYAVCQDSRVIDATGEVVPAFFLDHWPTGLTYWWCDSFVFILEVADAISHVTGDVDSLGGLTVALDRVRFAEWLSSAALANAGGKSHTRFADWVAELNPPGGLGHYDVDWLREQVAQARKKGW